MCRLAAYLGETETSLSSLTMEAEHSLLAQSYAPREMLSGVVNADGFGAAWYTPEVDDAPAVHRSNSPMWADRSFAGIAPKVRSRSIFAALRNATPGLPAEESGVPPFASGKYSFMHNGAIDGFRHTAMRPLRDTLSDERYSDIIGASDSETIFACLLDRMDGSTDLREAILETIRLVSDVCEARGTKATLNLGATDGEEMVFARHSTEGPDNSLYFIEGGEAFPNAVVVASERFDGDEGWREVPSRSLLRVGGHGVRTEKIPT
ncbi:MAG: ergothioneine biosynthesis protein EgtC [Rubrobacter sp.]|nr:ergothioneine biosynthesis protein EgtC [Rubrobacter sp.]